MTTKQDLTWAAVFEEATAPTPAITGMDVAIAYRDIFREHAAAPKPTAEQRLARLLARTLR